METAKAVVSLVEEAQFGPVYTIYKCGTVATSALNCFRLIPYDDLNLSVIES